MCKISILPSMIERSPDRRKSGLSISEISKVVRLPDSVVQCSIDRETGDKEKKFQEEESRDKVQDRLKDRAFELVLAPEDITAATAAHNEAGILPKDGETEHIRKVKSLVGNSLVRRPHFSNGRGYKAVNVKAINRSTETTAQHVNLSEDKRLARRLTSIDRERDVFRNSITRDEKIILQRSRALSEVILRRSAKKDKRTLSSPALVQKQDKPDTTYLYGGDIQTDSSATRVIQRPKSTVLRDSTSNRHRKLVRSQTTNKLRETTEPTVRPTISARQKWARSISDIMNKEIKQWHKDYLVSEEQRTTTRGGGRAIKTSSASRTPSVIPPVGRTTSRSSSISLPKHSFHDEPLYTPVISKHFLSSDSDIDKGAWITKYINTSCHEHLPML